MTNETYTLPNNYNAIGMYKFLEGLPFATLVFCLRQLWADLKQNKQMGVRQYNYSKRTIAIIHQLLERKGIYTTASIKDHGVMGAGRYIVHTGKTITVSGRNIYHQTNIYGKGRLGGTRYETRKGKVVSCKTMFKTTWHINYVTPDSDEWKIKAFKAVSSKAAEKHASDYCLRHGYTLLCVW